jgi:hypothetical protein
MPGNELFNRMITTVNTAKISPLIINAIQPPVPAVCAITFGMLMTE